jgi:acetylornithine deacetylase
MLREDMTARELMERLVAFPTVSRDSNLDLVGFIGDYLRLHGVEPVIVPSPDGRKAALYAHVGPDVPGGVVLSGHSDVVPVDGQHWTSDPWTVTERDGRLYGRGTCDMKGFVALALAAVPQAIRAGVKRPLQIAVSYDEEVGCTGAPPMIAHMVANGMPRAGTVIVGEPSMMKVVTGHKGSTGMDVVVRGHEVHSSRLPHGVSAIMEAVRIIGWMNDRNSEVRSVPPGPMAALFDPPFTTLHTGMIRGGTAQNITAAECWFNAEIRVVPGESVQEWKARFMTEVARIEARMQAVAPGCRIDVGPFFDIPPLVPEADGSAETLARRLTGDNGRHVVSYGTEAGQFQEAGYSVVVCGPGDIAQAHKADEFVSVAQFQAGEAFMERLVDWLAA